MTSAQLRAVAPYPLRDQIDALTDLSHGAKIILGRIVRFGKWVCWAKNLYLAQQIGVDKQVNNGKSPIQRILRELVKAGWLHNFGPKDFWRWVKGVGQAAGLIVPEECFGKRYLVLASAIPVAALTVDIASVPCVAPMLPGIDLEPDVAAFKAADLQPSRAADLQPSKTIEFEYLSEAPSSVPLVVLAPPAPDDPREERTDGFAIASQEGTKPNSPERIAEVDAILAKMPLPGMDRGKYRARLIAAPVKSPQSPNRTPAQSQGLPSRNGPRSQPATALDRSLADLGDQIGRLDDGSPSGEPRRLAGLLATTLRDKDPAATLPGWSAGLRMVAEGKIDPKELSELVRQAGRMFNPAGWFNVVLRNRMANPRS